MCEVVFSTFCSQRRTKTRFSVLQFKFSELIFLTFVDNIEQKLDFLESDLQKEKKRKMTSRNAGNGPWNWAAAVRS